MADIPQDLAANYERLAADFGFDWVAGECDKAGAADVAAWAPRSPGSRVSRPRRRAARRVVTGRDEPSHLC